MVEGVAAEPQRVAEVALQRVPEEPPELREERIVEAVGLVEGLDGFDRRADRETQRGGIADDVQRDEGDQQGPADHNRELSDPPEQVALHRLPLECRGVVRGESG